MQDLRYADTKYVFSAHLKCKFNWASRIFTYQIWGKEEMRAGGGGWGAYWEVSNGAQITEALNDLDLSKNVMSSWELTFSNETETLSFMKNRVYT